jgi:hypothetical protein
MSDELLCYRCGYDLRAHPEDGVCPECGGSVAEARQWAAIPRRPAWKESDPRWRRRMLAGVWVLALIPLMDVLQKLGLDSHIPVPMLLSNVPATLDNSLLSNLDLYPSILFCIGVVLLFSKESRRRASGFDWTRRWGIICTYVVALLIAVLKLLVIALVMAGISNIFMSMPPKNQPAITRTLVELSTRWLRYGPNPKDTIYCVLITFSSITILLACIPLSQALCGTGSKGAAKILLAPLALFALANIAQAGGTIIGYSRLSFGDPFYMLGPFFRPAILVWNELTIAVTPPEKLRLVIVEAVKLSTILAIAVRLSIGQLTARRRKRVASLKPKLVMQDAEEADD